MDIGLCQCGCGGKTKISPKTSTKHGYIRGSPRKFIAGHQNKRFRSLHRGNGNPHWGGDNVGKPAGRKRAVKLYKISECGKCGSTERCERHHKDGITTNNNSENILILCRKCHMEEDGRLNNFRISAKHKTWDTWKNHKGRKTA